MNTKEKIAHALATAYWKGRLMPEGKTDGLTLAAIDAASSAAASVTSNLFGIEAALLVDSLPERQAAPKPSDIKVAARNIFTRLEIDIKDRCGVEKRMEQNGN